MKQFILVVLLFSIIGCNSEKKKKAEKEKQYLETVDILSKEIDSVNHVYMMTGRYHEECERLNKEKIRFNTDSIWEEYMLLHKKLNEMRSNIEIIRDNHSLVDVKEERQIVKEERQDVY